MNTKLSTLKAALASSMILFGATHALAHSNHDHSTVGYNWEFSEAIKDKILRSMENNVSRGSVGLNKFEQKKMDHYGIQVGNKFKSRIMGNTVLVERNTMGVRILDVDRMNKSGNVSTLPIQKINGPQKISRGQHHPGHDHSLLPYKWTFGEDTHHKILVRLHNANPTTYVGLSKFEQKLFDEYDIKVGNTLQTSVVGHPATVKRTSAGITVKLTVQGESVASMPAGEMAADRF